MNVIAMALVMLSVVTILAGTPNGKPPSPSTTKSAPQLSKWQRAQLEMYNSSAPADQYFGPTKISYLGMNNTFRDAAIMAGDHTTDHTIVSRVETADDALREWATKFPRDPQLSRTYFLAINADKKIWLKPNQERAWVYMNRIVQLFPTSYFGKLVKKDVEIGFTEHYYADPVPCATPTPTPSPTVTPTATPTPQARRGRRATPTPEPTPPPTPEPTPSPTPTPAPTPSVVAKGLKVQIETPPCIAPATPTPSSSPSESPSPLFEASPAAPGSAPPVTATPGATVTPSPR